MKNHRYIKREDVDDLNEYLARRHEDKAAAKAGLPFIITVCVASGFGLKYLLGDVFFDGWYYVYGGFGVSFLFILFVGIDLGTRID